MWELEQNSMQGGRYTGQYIGETKRTKSMKVLKNAGIEKSRSCFYTPVDTVS